MRNLRFKYFYFGLLFTSMSTSVNADALKNSVLNCAGFSAEGDTIKRLACFDQLVKRLAPDPTKIDPWTASAQQKTDYNIQKELDSQKKHANDNLFLRNTTALGKENDKPAKIALTHANDITVGVARAALIYVDRGGLSDALGFKVAGDEKWFVGMGLHRDDTVTTKKISTSDLRLGYTKAFSVYPRNKKGNAVSSWVSLARLNDHIASNAKIQTDFGIEAGYRWIDRNNFDEVLHDRSIKFSFNPFSD